MEVADKDLEEMELLMEAESMVVDFWGKEVDMVLQLFVWFWPHTW